MDRLRQPAGVWQHVSEAPQAGPPLQLQTTPPEEMHHCPRPQGVPLHEQVPVLVLHVAPLDTPLPRHSLFVEQPQYCCEAPPWSHSKSSPEGPPCAVQEFPHPPQLVSFDWTFRSQPSSDWGAVGSVQLPKPRSQLDVQRPPEHARDATLELLHDRPHEPQWFTFVANVTSQPFCALPSQLPQPAEQVGTQEPSTQLVEPHAFEQTVPHDPQLFTDEGRCASHPSSMAPGCGPLQSE